MARIVLAKCPQCGAGLPVAAHDDLVTCRFCNHVSVIEREPRRMATALQQHPEWAQFQRIKVSARPPGWVIAALVLSVVVLPLVAVIAVAVHGATNPVKIDGFNAAAGVVPGASTMDLRGEALVGDHLDRVELGDLLKQTQAIALARQPNAKLTSLVGTETRAGLVDATRANAATVMFEYKFADASKPAGKDVVQGRLLLVVGSGRVLTIEQPSYSATSEVLEAPKCASTSAWASAVQSGVPSDAVAKFLLYDQAWSIRVEGHDEYRREIDAQTCKVVKSWGPTTDEAPRRKR